LFNISHDPESNFFVKCHFGRQVSALPFSDPTARSDPVCGSRGAPAERPVASRLFLWDPAHKGAIMTDDKRKKAALYLQTSAQNDEEALQSLDAQEEHCKRYAAEAGFEVEPEHVYREIGDGFGRDRPELQKLLQSAEDGRIGAVIVYGDDGLSENDFEQLEIQRDLNELEVEVRIYDPDPSEDEEPEG